MGEMQTMADLSVIRSFYTGANILLTGATGFMGKVLLEKLLRTCPDVGNVYVLIRTKKGQDPQARTQAIFDDPLFSRLKDEQPKFRHHVIVIAGDCSEPGLGLSPEDRATLVNNVNMVFHGAATVRFDEKIHTAVAINVHGTKAVLELCKELPNLKVVMHVSTAYSNCNLKVIEEKLYDMEMDAERVMGLVQTADEKILDAVTPLLLGEWPNTYAYTKALGENVVKVNRKGLPLGVFRPGIVVSTAQEPVAGWIDNLYGPTGVVVGAGVGLLRSLQADAKIQANMVPVDMAVNALLSAAWETAQILPENEIPVYNYVSSVEKPVTWGSFMELTSKYGVKVPPYRSVWVYSLTLTKYRYLHIFLTALLHFLPALIIDAICIAFGSPFRLVKAYKKIYKFSDVISYFSTREWDFRNGNVQALWNRLGEEDKRLFPFSMRNFDWDKYFQAYVVGCRLYVMKEDPKTIPQSVARWKKLYWLHQALKLFFVLLALRFCWWILSATIFPDTSITFQRVRSPFEGILRHWNSNATPIDL